MLAIVILKPTITPALSEIHVIYLRVLKLNCYISHKSLLPCFTPDMRRRITCKSEPLDGRTLDSYFKKRRRMVASPQCTPCAAPLPVQPDPPPGQQCAIPLQVDPHAQRDAIAATPVASSSSPSCAQSSNADPRAVTSMRDLFRFAHVNLELTGDKASAARTISESLIAIDSLSSAFSGICAETVALNIVQSQVEATLGTPVHHPRYLAAVDHNIDCQHEVSLLPHGPECQFTALEDFCSPSLKSDLDHEIAPFDSDRLVAMCSAPNALSMTAPCSRHRRQCRFRRAGVHAGGLPCTDFTTWGSCNKLEGKTSIGAAIWIAMRLVLREAVILVEEVPGFPNSFLERYLGPLYHITTFCLCNTLFGVPARRLRRYFLLTLKVT